MEINNYLVANVKALRKAYGETQEQLGEAIGVVKSAISMYETEKRGMDKEIVKAISEHYMVSIDEIMYSDLTEIKKIDFDPTFFTRGIELIFPIASSVEAMKNPDFKKAHEMHCAIYARLRKNEIDIIDDLFECIEKYGDAYDDESIKLEAAANILGEWFFINVMFITTPMAFRKKSAMFSQMALKKISIKEYMEISDKEWENYFKEMEEALWTPEATKEINKMFVLLKKSSTYQDLADYYLALRYIYNLVDNDLDWEINHRIGSEMLYTFRTVGNKYATRITKLIKSTQNGSSRIVDDK